MSRQGSRDPLACFLIPLSCRACSPGLMAGGMDRRHEIDSGGAGHILLSPNECSFAERTCDGSRKATTKGLTGLWADRKVGRLWEIVPSRRNSWLKVMRLPETALGKAISCGSEVAMDTRRVSIAWRVLSRGFLSGTPINWRGPTWNTVATPPGRTAERGSLRR